MTRQHAIAHMHYQLYRHGWGVVFGLALLGGAIGLHFGGVVQTRTQVAELRAQALAQRQRLVQKPNQDELAAKRLLAFHAGLPASTGAMEAIDAIHRAAAANGVKLANGEYRLARDGGARLLRYQITLPARASYPQLRAWIGEVMNAVPSAALDEISFRRDDVGSDSVEARVRMTLFLRAS